MSNLLIFILFSVVFKIKLTRCVFEIKATISETIFGINLKSPGQSFLL